MIGTILFIVFVAYVVVGTYLQIPAEDLATIEARKYYGKAK